jgi:DNA-directed RNA polymerase subunit RPC12/RpoP
MELEYVACSKCGHDQFLQLTMFAKVPAVLSQTGKAGISPQPGKIICAECGTDIIAQFTKEAEEESTKSKIILTS